MDNVIGLRRAIS